MIQRLILVITHALCMWRVLSQPRNVAKGSWRGIGPRPLLERAREELAELEMEVWLWENGHLPGPSGIHGEAADVSAYVAMIADVCGDRRWIG